MLLSHVFLALGGLTSQAAPQLALQAVRFYAPSAQQTYVMAFLQVPYALTEPAGGRIAWETTMVVRDAENNEIYKESWWSGAPATHRVPDAYAMEDLILPMKSGRYRIFVTVRDSVSNRSANVETAVEGYRDTPGISDLLLASQMRLAEGADTVPGPGEISRGNIRFVTTPSLTLDALRPNLAFLMEAYTNNESRVTTRMTVKDKAGTVIHSLPPFEQTVPEGGGVIRGQFSLEGLSEGNYVLVASVNLGGRSFERESPFAVGSLEAAMARDVAQRTTGKLLDEVYFENLPEAELDAAAEVLELIARNNQLAVYQAKGDGALSVRAKRKFLIDFWQERDATPATDVNETRIAFYDAIDYANQNFSDAGRNARPGWKTDRGRIFVRNGMYDDKYSQPSSSGRGAPFEIWRYTASGRPRFYIFADRSNFGNFVLIKTNDLQEASAPNWAEILTPEVVLQQVETFLGQRFCRAQGADANQLFCS
jgi:GWxTD domain-containing protein